MQLSISKWHILLIKIKKIDTLLRYVNRSREGNMNAIEEGLVLTNLIGAGRQEYEEE